MLSYRQVKKFDKTQWWTLNICLQMKILRAVPLFSVHHWVFLFILKLYLFCSFSYAQVIHTPIWQDRETSVRCSCIKINRDSCREPRICNIIKIKQDKSWRIWFMQKGNFENKYLLNEKQKPQSESFSACGFCFLESKKF